MNSIVVPQINANEDMYTLQQLLVKEGTNVCEGTSLAAIASSKSVMELVSENKGIIHWLKNVGDEVKVGEKLADFFESQNEYEQQKNVKSEEKSKDYVLTNSAAEFAEKNGITTEEIKSIGKKIIKKTDLEQLIERRGNVKNRIVLTPNQKGVAKTVIASTREIPKAFQLNKFDCSKMESIIAELSEKIGVPIGYAEVMTFILFRLYEKYPIFYGKYNGKDEVVLPDKVSVGITMDCGNGLFVPAIHEEDAGSIESLAEKILEYKLCTVRGEFSADQLCDSSISIALNNEPGTLFVHPIIMPNQLAILSIGSVQKELCLEEDGTIREHSFVHIGIAYDHRVINGYQAMSFMGEIGQLIENFIY